MENKQEEKSFPQTTLQFLNKYEQELQKEREKESEQTINVDTIASKVAAFYEKLRMIVDWKDEHLIRRMAIERSLKRKLISELGFRLSTAKLDPAQIAESLLVELIRGGHLPNNAIPKSKISEVSKILKKYILTLEKTDGRSQGTKDKINFYHWVLEMGACELEETLEPPIKQKSLINFMTNQLSKRLRFEPGLDISEKKKWTLTYIAVHRSLFRLDSPIIHYHLLKKILPNWETADGDHIEKAAQKMPAIRTYIEELMEHPLYPKFYKYCEYYNTYYLILNDILEKLEEREKNTEKDLSAAEVLKEQKKWEPLARQSYSEREKTLRSRLNRIAAYSTLSIFVAGAASLVIVEIPLARLFGDGFSLTSLAVDMLVPTVWMFILVGTAPKPEKSNADKVIEGISKTIYKEGEWGVYEIEKPRKRSFLGQFLITLFYFLVWGVSLSSIAALFYFTGVPLPSVVLDTINVAVVTFVGIEIRQRAGDLSVGEEKTNLITFLFDTLSLPIAKFGKWFTDKWKEYNIVSVFFTALLDMPFLAFIDLIESWSAFLKEKKSGMYS